MRPTSLKSNEKFTQKKQFLSYAITTKFACKGNRLDTCERGVLTLKNFGKCFKITIKFQNFLNLTP